MQSPHYGPPTDGANIMNMVHIVVNFFDSLILLLLLFLITLFTNSVVSFIFIVYWDLSFMVGYHQSISAHRPAVVWKLHCEGRLFERLHVTYYYRRGIGIKNLYKTGL
jgi:hypothetical protein